MSGWMHRLLALIPKVECPTGPSMRKPSWISACGKNRQAADLLAVATRIRDVTREWRLPLLVAKLDVRGAFDRRVVRKSVASLLRSPAALNQHRGRVAPGGDN